MINLPIDLNGAQRDRLDALLVRGGVDLFVHDQHFNGAPVYVLVARGAARDWIIETISGTPTSTPPEPPPGPPAKVVAVSTGASAARPGGGDPNRPI